MLYNDDNELVFDALDLTFANKCVFATFDGDVSVALADDGIHE